MAEHKSSRVVPNTVGPRKRRMTCDTNPAESLNLFLWFMIPLLQWWRLPFGPDLQRPCLTFWQREGHIPSWIYLGLTNHLSSLQSYQLLNYGWEVDICGQKPGPGLIKPELAPSFQGQSASRNPTACFPRPVRWMKKCQVFPRIMFSQILTWLLTVSVKQLLTHLDLSEMARKPRWAIKDLQKLLPICLHSSSSKTICSAVWWDPVKR